MQPCYNVDMAIRWTQITVRLGDLQPWADNPRVSSNAQAERILRSMDAYGQALPVLVSPSLQVLDGHQRLSALLTRYGPDYTLAAWQSDRELTDAERRELVLALHNATGSWDWDTLANWEPETLTDWGFDEALRDVLKRDLKAVDELLASLADEPPEDPGAQIDRAEELRAKWGVEPGQLWRIPSKAADGEHRIICGDCTDADTVARVMMGELAAMVWTDPPYGVRYGDKIAANNPMGYKPRNIQNDSLSDDDLRALINRALRNAADNSSDGAAIYVAAPPGRPLPTIISAFVGSGFEFRWHLVWVKNSPVLSRADYHFRHENILYGWRRGQAHRWYGGRREHSVFEYPRPQRSDEHPTMKPPALVAHMLRNSSQVGDVVLDTFSGSGTTIVACEQAGRLGRGVEIEPKYVAVTLERLAGMGLEPELVEPLGVDNG